MKTKEILFGLFVALFLAAALGPFASSRPDGLMKIANDNGFSEKASHLPLAASLLHGYAWGGVKNEALAAAIAGVFGTIIIFCLGYGLAVVLKWKKR